MRTTLLAAASVGAMILFSNGFAAKAAEIKIIAAGPLTAAFNELGPQFERDTGHKLVTKFAGTSEVKREIDAGEPFDLAISITSAIDDWINEGKIVAATRAVVGYAGLGLGVRAGAPKPDIGSVEASKRTLLNAKSVAHGAEGAIPAYFTGLLARLGIVEEMKPKRKPMATAAVLKSVASGELEFIVAAVPTIIAAPGVELVGPFPSELQTYISFTAGASTRAKEPGAAQALIKFLTSPAAVATIKAKGMEPGTPR
jgi:molybdate transport system substrate-binding protein